MGSKNISEGQAALAEGLKSARQSGIGDRTPSGGPDLEVQALKTSSVRKRAGMFKRHNQAALSVERMDETIAEAATLNK
jgi:hypothetical protein